MITPVNNLPHFDEVMAKSLFSHFSKRNLRHFILPHLRVHRFTNQSPIQQPVTTDRLYVVVEGTVDLYKGSFCIGSVTKGRSLELQSVLHCKPHWSYEWRAHGMVTLISVERDHLFLALESEGELNEYFSKMVSHRCLRHFSHDLHLMGLSPGECRSTITALKKISTSQLHELENGTHLAILESGRLEIETVADHRLLRAGKATVFDKGKKTRFEIDSPNDIWVLSFSTWQTFLSSQQIEEVKSFIDPLDELNPMFDSFPENISLIEDDDTNLDESDVDLAPFLKNPSNSQRSSRKRPFVAQHEQMDCGSACLSMVLKFHGKKISIARLRDSLNISTAGSSLSDMQRTAVAYGLEAMAIETDAESLLKFQTPFISLNQNHYVVVYDLDDKNVTIGDPGTGVFSMPFSDFKHSYSSAVLLLAPSLRLSNLKEDQPPLHKMLSLVRGHELAFIRILIVQLLVFGLSLIFPIFLQLLFDEVLPEKDSETLILFFFGFVLLTGIKILVEWCSDYLTSQFSGRFVTKLSATFLSHVFSLPLSHFSVRKTGDFLTRLDELRKIQRFLLGKPVQLITQLLSALVFGIALIFYHPILFFIALTGVPLTFLIVKVWSRTIRDLTNRHFNSRSRAESKFIEALGNLDTLRSLSAGVSARWRWQSEFFKLVNVDRLAVQASSKVQLSSQIVEHVINTAILFAVCFLSFRGALSMGQAVAATVIAFRFVDPLIAILSDWKSFTEIAISFEKVDEVLTAPPEPDFLPSEKVDLRGQIDMNDISFRYGGDGSPLVLSNINLNIRSGETVAFVGASGSGKTTLAKIINQLYFPVSGDLHFDGRSTTQLSLSESRKQIGMILQENSFFPGTVLENIALGDERPSLERAIQAARLADAHDFISQLEKGYFQILSSESELSGGERQRLAIARAFYMQPKILIMDEATSALDSISERKIMRSLNKNPNLMTVIMIAHRLNSIVDVDRIVVFSQGRIVEQGDHTSLMKRRGHYYQLVRRQNAA